MTHIVIISTSFPEQKQSGSEAAGSFVGDFADELSRHAQVTVIAPGLNEDCETDNNLQIRRFAVPRLPLSLLSPINPLHWPLIFKTLRAGRRAVDQLIAAKPVDHILALWALPSGYWAQRIWRRHGIPYSVWALGSDIWTLGKIPVIRHFLRQVLQQSKMCFADGYALSKDVERIAGRPCEFLPSTRILPVTESKQMASTPPYRIAFLGRWHPNKGIDLLMESLQLLADDDWTRIREFRICGGGILADMVRSHGARLNEAGRPVTIEGYKDKGEAAQLLSWADYLVIPSRIESIPVVFSDAIQASCPVIATPVGDLPRLLQEPQTGILASQVSAAAIATAIRVALNTPPVTFCSALNQVSGLFSLGHACERFIRLLQVSGNVAAINS